MRRQWLWIAAILLCVSLASPGVTPATGCPMCKEANETDDFRPRAYMFSILFMLAVPATVFTGFSIGFYRLSKRQQAAADLLDDDDAFDIADEE